MVFCNLLDYLTQKSISSAQLARDINVTQKTAWFMLCRNCENLRDDDATFESDTQVDETSVLRPKLDKEVNISGNKIIIWAMGQGVDTMDIDMTLQGN